MYINPAFLPQFSNREDLLLTVSIFDDDTVPPQPVKLDGCTTALSTPFTGSAWTVISGTNFTTSVTPLTIPVFPITSSALLNLNLTVGVGLAINPGDPVVIKDATGLNKMTGYVASYVISTGAMVAQIGDAFFFEIRRGSPRNTGSGYVPWYDFGTPNECGPLLRASNGQGISIIDTGVIQILIPAAMFERLHGGTYTHSLIVTDGVSTRQVSVGSLPVVQAHLTKVPIIINPGPVWN